MATPVLSRVERIPRISRFGWLMGLYAENFALLTRLFEPADLAPGSWVSCIGDGQDTLGMFPPPGRLLDHRLRMNTFLGKWLHYLGEQGHGVATLQHAEVERDAA